MSVATSASKHTNRLIHETSPYLLQHAHNPVDWYAWGPEAFEAARRENKPIFLSVGYSSCYWCHVMERQCFENEQVAREMNQRFISIKVDREERPDVDQLYILAVQVLTGQGGWPMSVFLAPDLRPFYGGTYFPPTDAGGRPGFVTILRAIEDYYRNRPADVEKTAAQLGDILQQLSRPQAPESPIPINWEFLDELVQRSISDADATHGGFGTAPKFPRQTLLELMLAYLDARPANNGSAAEIDQRKSTVLTHLSRALDAMAHGGIRDHLGGGFHRYSTDAQWLVPHFEIMLYDNAMLAWVYTEAHRQSGHGEWAKVARGALDFVLREMTSPEGAFYTAFDAEVEAREGASYLWTAQEIESLLGPDDARLFGRVYGLDRGPNFADPHHGTGLPEQNVLHLPQPLETVAAEMGLTAAQLEQRLEPLRRKLYEHRRQRKQPMLDTKIITSWNGLMIRALAHAGRVLSEPRYTQAAARAADFLLARHRRDDGRLWRTSRDGQAKHEAFLDDYAFLAQALLELSQSPGQEHRREQAGALAHQLLDRFADRDEGGFYFTPEGAQDLLVRQKVGTDSPLPAGNAVAAMALLDLDHDIAARDAIAAFARQIETSAESMSAMVGACIAYLRSEEPFTVSPGPWRGEQASSQRPPTPEQVAAGVVSVQTDWHGPMTLRVCLNVLDSFHINAHAPGADVTPTTLVIGGELAGAVETVEYPPGEEQRFAYADRPLRVYAGRVELLVRFKREVTTRGPIPLALTYQACNEQACFPVVTKRVDVAEPGIA